MAIVPGHAIARAECVEHPVLVEPYGSGDVPRRRDENGAVLVGENHRLLGGQFVGIAGRVVDDIATGRLAIEPFAHIALCTSGPPGDLAGSHRAGIPHRAAAAALRAEAD